MLSRDRTDGRSSEHRRACSISARARSPASSPRSIAPEPAGRGAPGLRVLGIGHQRSRGVKAGVITDLDEAETTVRAAIAQAERMAGVTLEEVFVSVSCGRLRSPNFSATVDVEGGVVARRRHRPR